MDIQRKNPARKKIIRWTVTGILVTGAVVGISLYLKNLPRAAQSVQFSTLWPDTVKRGPMIRDVHGLGTLVPEDTMLIPATTDGRVESILIKPGTPVKANSVVMVLTSPELETQLHDAEFAVKTAEAEYANLKVTLQKSLLDLQSTAAQVGGDATTAKLQADRDQALLKDGLVSEIDAKISANKYQELQKQYQLKEQQIAISGQSDTALLAGQQVKLDQMRSQYGLKRSQVDQLKVRAGFDGMLQQLPTPLTPVEVGQKVTAGTPLGKVAQPTHLKAELKIAETQVKDIAIGQPAVIDTRLSGGGANGLIEGHVSRIDPSILNGTVTVDVALNGRLPEGARPDLSVDGTIQLEKLDDVVYVGRPVVGQQDSTVQLFKVDPDGKYASKVKVTFGRTSVTSIEVKQGLKVGDRVILSDMSAFDNVDRIKLD